MLVDRRRVSGFLVGFVATVAGAVLLLFVWVGIAGLRARSMAVDLQQSIAAAAAAAQHGDGAAAAENLSAAQAAATDLSSAVDSAPLSWTAGLPVVGDTVSAVSVITAATAAVLQPLASRADVASAAATLAGPQVPAAMQALSEARPTLASAAAVAAGDRASVAAIDPDAVVGPMRGQVTDARDRFLGLADGLTAALGASRALPTVLGTHGPRTWLVVLQSPAEARGTGGLVGAYSLIRVADGRIRAVQVDSNNSLTADPVSLAGIPRDTRALWGTDLAYLWGLNLDRHFPYAATLVQRTLPPGAPRVDDVIMLDPASIAALMSLTGPVTSRGVTVRPDEARAFFTSEVYARFPKAAEKDAVIVDMLKQTLTRLATRQLDLPRVWRALSPLAGGQHVLMASNDDDVQQGLAMMPTSGIVPEQPGPWATVAVNDVAGSKMDAYLHTDVVYESGSMCPAAGTDSTLTMRVRNGAPVGLSAYGSGRVDKVGGPPGSTKVSVAFYAPVGSQRTGVLVDGRPAAAAMGVSRAHPVWVRSLDLKRGETREFSVRFREPYWPGVPPVFQPQPMANDMGVQVRKPAGC